MNLCTKCTSSFFFCKKAQTNRQAERNSSFDYIKGKGAPSPSPNPLSSS